MPYEILGSPKKIGNCEIKNRIVMPPMLMGFANLDGTPTEKLLDYYEERAKGGCGLIMTEITRINDRTGSAAFAQLSASHDYNVEPLRELGERIHRHGAKIFVQLHHPGRQNIGLLVGTVPLSIAMEKLTKGLYSKLLYKITPKIGPTLIKKDIVPRSVAPSKCPPAYFAGGRIRALRYKEIKQLEKQFIEGAVRVQKAGIDGVELHSAHGYLLQQFLSPVTNNRADEYGGSLENRTRFIVNILRGIKEKCGEDFPVIVRLSVDECYSYIGEEGKGYSLEEGVEIAKILERNGADAIDVSSAGYDTFNYWLEPVSFPLGWRKYMAKAVKEAVSIPVLAANLIRTPEQAETQLKEGYQDFVSLGRPQIADPHWANKVLTGSGIPKRCICCLNCIESMQNNAYIGGHGECSVNPFVGKEKTVLNRNGEGKKVLVIGAGPAGLTCAEILARRGFCVTVAEKNTTAGGQINLASAPPAKDKTRWIIEDLVDTCLNLGVDIKYGVEVDEEFISHFSPYATVVASGSNPVMPKFLQGKENVVTFREVLNGAVEVNNKTIAVIGSGMTGLETAHYLTERGNKVTVVEMADEIAPGTWMQHRDDILPHLKKADTVFCLGTKLVDYVDGKIVLERVKDGKGEELKVDLVVLALGSRPDQKITHSENNIYYIGDCEKIGKIADATKRACEIALSID